MPAGTISCSMPGDFSALQVQRTWNKLRASRIDELINVTQAACFGSLVVQDICIQGKEVRGPQFPHKTLATRYLLGAQVQSSHNIEGRAHSDPALNLTGKRQKSPLVQPCRGQANNFVQYIRIMSGTMCRCNCDNWPRQRRHRRHKTNLECGPGAQHSTAQHMPRFLMSVECCNWEAGKTLTRQVRPSLAALISSLAPTWVGPPQVMLATSRVKTHLLVYSARCRPCPFI